MQMRIPLSSPDVSEPEIEAVVSVLRGRTLSQGPKIVEFEKMISDFVGTQFAVAVNTGTSGLHLCIRALNLKSGDEVITSPFSFIASANVMLYERASPVFVDIDPVTLNIDPAKIEAAITDRTRALMIVHVFGRPAPMDEIKSIALKHGLKIIEDACEALGAETRGRMAGSIGEAGVFAFYPNKQITTGEGGAIVTDSEDIRDRVIQLRNHGRDPRSEWFEHVELGYNYRISDINCALGVEQLRRIDEILTLREGVATRYGEMLRDNSDLILPNMEFEGGRISWFVYVVLLKADFRRAQRDWVIEQLKAEGIGCGRYFAPIHLQPLYKRLFGYIEGDFPIAEDVADRAIALPFFNRLTETQQWEVCSRLTNVVRRARTEAA